MPDCLCLRHRSESQILAAYRRAAQQEEGSANRIHWRRNSKCVVFFRLSSLVHLFYQQH